MGLDFVELVMDVETHFGIKIRNDEFPGLRTVGDFVSLIRTRIIAASERPCPSLSSFLELRRLVRETTGNPGLRIRPSETVYSRLSAMERRRFWKRLPNILGTDPDDLQRPRFLHQLLLFAIAAMLVFAFRYSIVTDVLILPLMLFVWLLVSISLYRLTVCFKVCPPSAWSTFGDITRHLVSTVAATKRQHLANDESILEELRSVFVEVLNLDKSLIVPSALLVEDLKVG